MSIRLVGLGAMSAPRRRRVPINWCLLAWGLFAATLWVPIVLGLFWMRGLL